jgi:AcrR family transcriptional regulator
MERMPTSLEPGAASDTRRKIVRAALALGARAGNWDAVHVHEVARQAGVPMEQLREHFGDKDAIAEGCFDEADAALLRMGGQTGWAGRGPSGTMTAPMAALNPSTLTILALTPLIAWRIYARVRRMVGRQRVSRVRLWITLILFPLLLGLLSMSAYAHWERLGWLAGGLAAGAGLAVFGLKHTRFEPTREGLFYTPNAHLGIALSLLFVGRIGWRLAQLFIHGMPQPGQPDDFTTSPLTLSIVGLLFGYYIGYAIGLMRWRLGVLRAKRMREAAQADSGNEAAP